MEIYKPEYPPSRLLFHPELTKKSIYGFDGRYSELDSSASTAVDEDKRSLLNAVLENFSNNIGDESVYSDTILPLGYKRIIPAEVNYSNNPLADWYSQDSLKSCGNAYQKQQNFSWTKNTPSNCFGTDKAQLYEKLFDSYINQFSADSLYNATHSYLDGATDVPPSALDSEGWDSMQTIEALDQLTVSRKPKPSKNNTGNNSNSNNNSSNNTRHKIEHTNAVDKNKNAWRRKRGGYKGNEKKPLPQLTGKDFDDAMKHLTDVLESLYRDQIPPTFFNVRSRFVEFDTKNIPVEQIMNICQQRQDVFKVVTNESLNQTFIYFVTPPSYFTKWIDRNDLTDIYPEEMWNQFLDLLVELVNNPDNTLPVFPGSIYGTAKVFKQLELSFFSGMTLGTLCHIVQLAVRVRKLLMYELKTLKPNLVAILQACVNRAK